MSDWIDDTVDMADYGMALLNTTENGGHNLDFTDYLESMPAPLADVILDEDGWLTMDAEFAILEYVNRILPDTFSVLLDHQGGDEPHITFSVTYTGTTTPSTVFDDYYSAYAILHNATDDYRIYRYAANIIIALNGSEAAME